MHRITSITLGVPDLARSSDFYTDFGLTPLEAGAFGHPTLAYRAGGFLDTILEGTTGLFFDEPTPEAVRDAVLAERGVAWDADAIRAHVASYSEERFIARLRELVDEL